MKKRLLHLLIPLLAASSADAAAAADELHSLIISFHEGDSVAIVLADKPRATIHDDSLHVETADFSATYLRSAIADFHLGWYSPTTTSIEILPEHMVQIVYTDNVTVLVRGIDDASHIGVYGLDGRRILAELTSDSDGVAIDLTAYPAGIYLIQINNKQTFKIIRR